METKNFNDYLRRQGFKIIPGEVPVQRLNKDYQIEIIMDEFDWVRVHNVLTFLNWTWFRSNSPTGVPTIEEMKNAGRDYLERMWETEVTGENPQLNCTGSGGLEAQRVIWDGLKILSLRFILSEWFFDYDDVQHEPERYMSEDELVKINRIINLKNNSQNS